MLIDNIFMFASQEQNGPCLGKSDEAHFLKKLMNNNELISNYKINQAK